MAQPLRTYLPEGRARLPNVLARHGLTLQLARFGIAGAVAFGIYAGGTLLLSGPLNVPIVLAIGMAYVVGATIHFLLQRHFVFMNHAAFALPPKAQVGRYMAVGVCQYTLTSVLVTTLPGVIGTSQQLTFLGTVLAVSTVSFLVLRAAIFHAPASSGV